MKSDDLLEYLQKPKWDRIFRIKDALMAGLSVSSISKASHGIDPWFLNQIKILCKIEKEIAEYKVATMPEELIWTAKENGFSDEQIVRIMNQPKKEDEFYEKRKELG